MALALWFSVLAVSACQQEASTPASPLEVLEPWTRVPAVAGQDASVAIYLVMVNTGPGMMVLTDITSPRTREGMLHETTLMGDIARMRPVTQVPIASGARVTLRPGSLHGMLRGLDPVVTPGGTIPVELHFQDGSKVHVSVPVRAR
ncbi:MAG: copper chaperone PCu(A)C [Gemmatimonadota bacterium]